MRTSCAIGCCTDGSRCFATTPSNDLGAALDQAAQLAAITLPAGAVVDSDTGAVSKVRNMNHEKRRRSAASGSAARISGRARNGTSSAKSAPNSHGSFA